ASKAIRPGRCIVLLTVTTRAPGVASSRSRRRPVSAKWPRWFVPSCISKPSAVSRRGIAITPALLTRTCRAAWRLRKASAKAWIEARLARSSGSVSTAAGLGAPWRTVRSAARARSGLRQARTTCAPRRASARAVSSPSPLFAPVTIATLPASGGRSSAVQLTRSASPVDPPAHARAAVEAVIGMAGDELRIAEREDQERAGHEAAHVGPERDVAALVADRGGAADQLDQEPVAEHQHRRHGDRGHVEAEHDQHVHPHARVEDHVRAHHP